MTKFIKQYIDSLPDNIEIIDVSYTNIDYLPDLSRFKNLQELNCSNNKLTDLPSLNDNLQKLNCSNNELTYLPNLNDNLTELNCPYNKLTCLTSLNKNLQKIYSANNVLFNINMCKHMTSTTHFS